jgi:hypothetical protein
MGLLTGTGVTADGWLRARTGEVCDVTPTGRVFRVDDGSGRHRRHEGLELSERRADGPQVAGALLIRRGLLDERQGALRLPEIEEDLPQEAGFRGTTTRTSLTPSPAGRS